MTPASEPANTRKSPVAAPLRQLAAAIALLASAVVFGDDTPGNFEQEVTAEAKGVIEVSSTSGTIDVVGTDKPAVGVTAELGPEVDHVEVRPGGNHTSVRVVLRNGSVANSSHGETHLHVQIPKDSELHVSGAGNVSSTGVLGSQQLRSVTGDVSADTGPGDFQATSMTGNLKIRGHGQPARLRLNSANGDIELTNGAGELNAMSMRGHISVELDPARSFIALTFSGDITFDGRLARGAVLDMQSSDGNLKVRALSEDGFRYDLESQSGDLSNCFNAKAERSSAHGPGQKLDGKRGAGSANVHMKTKGGSLELCDQ